MGEMWEGLVRISKTFLGELIFLNEIRVFYNNSRYDSVDIGVLEIFLIIILAKSRANGMM
jgi:hypothetical protein